jgi:uncharacterized YccA/Bax inhibitor family protein
VIVLAGILGVLLLLMASTMITLFVGTAFDLMDAKGNFDWYVFPTSFVVCLAAAILMIYLSNRRK